MVTLTTSKRTGSPWPRRKQLLLAGRIASCGGLDLEFLYIAPTRATYRELVELAVGYRG